MSHIQMKIVTIHFAIDHLTVRSGIPRAAKSNPNENLSVFIRFDSIR